MPVTGSPSTPPSTLTDDGLPLPRPVRTRRARRFTYSDCVDHLLLNDDVRGTESKIQMRAKRAVKSANDQIATHNAAGWRCLNSHVKLQGGGKVTLPEFTVATESGSTKLVTITGTPLPTLPDWLKYGHIKVDREWYPIVDPITASATTFKIEALYLADATYDAGSVEQLIIPVPINYRRRGEIIEDLNRYPIGDVGPNKIWAYREFYNNARNEATTNKFAAITSDERYQGAYFLSVWPIFGADTELSMFYERYPSLLDNHRVATSGVTCSTSGESATVTASAAFFDADLHVGAAIRFASNSTETLHAAGSDPDLVVAERIITSVDSTTAVTVDQPINLSTARAFYVSDVIDIEAGTLFQAYLKLCEYEFARSMNSKFKQDRYIEFVKGLELALEDDSRYDGPASTVGEEYYGSRIGQVNARPL